MAGKLQKKMWWENKKTQLAIGGGVALLIIIIIIIIIRDVPLKNKKTIFLGIFPLPLSAPPPLQEFSLP